MDTCFDSRGNLIEELARMSDLTPRALVESAIQKSVLRVAIVHAPSSSQQADGLKQMLESKGVETKIINVSFYRGFVLT